MIVHSSRVELRIAVISALVSKASPHSLGRTAIMKLVYFLQILHDLPLRYDFRIYTYGPYDSQVLEDLKVAELKGAVKSSVIGYTMGTGYAITAGDNVEPVIARCPEIQNYARNIEIVVAEFGSRSAVDLEMASTIIFVDRTKPSGFSLSIQDIAKKIIEMKPRLDIDRIMHEALVLKEKGYIHSN